MKNSFIKICLATLAFQVLPAFATVVNTPASKAASGVRDMIAHYLQVGGDINELTMDDIMSKLDPEAAQMVAHRSIPDRFEILAGSGPVDEVTKAKMIAYTANRISEDRHDGDGRYVIWLAGEELYYNWEPEQKVAALLGDAGMKLVDRGPWTQPPTKEQSMFHVSGQQLPPAENQKQEDQEGRRLLSPAAKGQNEQRDTALEPKTSTNAIESSILGKSGAKAATANHMSALTSWLVGAGLTVAGAGLLWLLLKNPKQGD